MIDIIECLKQRRKAMKMRQAELGKMLGLPQSHISSIEREETDPRLSTIVDMARILDHELVLIPRPLVPAINALLHGDDDSERRWKPDEVIEDDQPTLHKREIW